MRNFSSKSSAEKLKRKGAVKYPLAQGECLLWDAPADDSRLGIKISQCFRLSRLAILARLSKFEFGSNLQAVALLLAQFALPRLEEGCFFSNQTGLYIIVISVGGKSSFRLGLC